jgi:hypothetical protein
MGRRKSRAEWSRIVEGLEASGMSAKEYARQHRLNLENLRWWRSMLRRRARDDNDRSPPPMMIVALRPIPAVAVARRASISIHAGGVRVSVMPGFEPATLSAVLEVLERRARGAR